MTVGSVDNARSGSVFITDYDRGIITTLGGVTSTDGSSYVIKNIPGVHAPPNYEGVPIYFDKGDDTIQTQILPSFVIRRDSMTPAMSRWHLGAIEYSVPAINAVPVTVVHPITGEVIATGWDRYEQKPQAVPFDLTYNIEIRARFRNNLDVAANAMLLHAMRVYQPYTRVAIKDSLNDTRYYTAFTESQTAADIMSNISDRENNFNLSVRIEAELDLNDPYVVSVMKTFVSTNLTVR